MCVLGKKELTEMVQKYKCIHPFDYNLLDGDGYVLTVREERTLNYLEHQNLVSYEVVFTPPSFVAHLTAKSKYGRMGLSFLNAAKVHSGFVGRLALELVNLGNSRESITIRRGDPLMHIEFLRRDGDPSPYSGSYMFQYMNEDETKDYLSVISNHFRSVFNQKLLDEQVKKRVQIQQ